MTFLKKLGMLVVNIAGIAAGVGPLIKPFLGAGKAGQLVETGVNDLTSIASTVVQIEVALQGKPGAEKYEAAVLLVGPILRTSQLLSGKKIADEALLTKAIGEITQGVVDLLQSVHPDEAKA